jgi:uncharacterized membrane protein
MDDSDLAEIRDRLTAIEGMVGDLCVALGAAPHASAPTQTRPVAPQPAPPIATDPTVPTVPDAVAPPVAARVSEPVHPEPSAPQPAISDADAAPAPAIGPIPTPRALAKAKAAQAKAKASASKHTVEAMIGGKGLAILGGLAVLVGIVFFVAVAIRNGVLPPGLRMLLAALGSAGLVGGAERVHRMGHGTSLPGVLAVVGLLGGFATMLGTINGFDLIPTQMSLVISPVIGAIAVWCGHRYGVAFLIPVGVVLAIVGPVISQVDPSTGRSAYAFGIMLLAAALTLRFRWVLLWPIGVIGVAFTWGPWFTKDWYEYSSPAVGLTALSLALFATFVIAVAADGHLSLIASPAPIAVPILPGVTASVSVTGVALLRMLSDNGHAEDWWVTGLAIGVSWMGLAVSVRWRPRLTGPFLVAIGFALGAAAIVMWFQGPGRTIGWAAQAIIAAWAARSLRDDRPLLGSFVALTMATAGALELCRPRALGWDEVPWEGVLAVSAVAIAAAAVAWLSHDIPEQFLDINRRRTLVLLSLSGLATWYGGSVAVVQALGVDHDSTQVVLSALWAITGLALIVTGLLRRNRFIRIVGLSLSGLVIAKLVLIDLRYLEATSRALSFIVVGLFAMAGAYAYQRVLAQFTPATAGPVDTPPDASGADAS